MACRHDGVVVECFTDLLSSSHRHNVITGGIPAFETGNRCEMYAVLGVAGVRGLSF